jgi:hypothetical protein
MKSADTIVSLGRARTSVRWALAQTATPSSEVLDRCLPVLKSAEADLRDFTLPAAGAAASKNKKELLRQLRELKKDLGSLATMLDHAAGFYDGCKRLHEPQDDGYDARGAPQPSCPASRVSVEG